MVDMATRHYSSHPLACLHAPSPPSPPSPQEASKLREAMKKPEFRKLLQEYAQEISDPENKKVNSRFRCVDDPYPFSQKYEEELIALEKQRGVDMKYIHPTVMI